MIQEYLTLPAFSPSSQSLARQRTLNLGATVSGHRTMWAAYEQVIANQPREVGRKRAVTEFLPAQIYNFPQTKGKGNPLCYSAERSGTRIVPAAVGDVLHSADELHQKSLTFLPRAITHDELAVHCIMRCLSENLLAAADQEKGKLRTFLLTDARYFLADERDRAQAKKRGGGVVTGLDSAWAEERYATEPVDQLSPDRLYQRRWAITVLEYSLQLLQEEFTAAGKAELFATLRPFLGFADVPQQSYTAISREAAMPAGTLKNHVFRLRKRWRELLFEQVALTLDDPTPDDIRCELAELLNCV
jgi:DNA-directed RNA polymerase specialized sigma24 family protein